MKHPEFIKTIKKAMRAKKLSLRALSRETGIEVSFLSKILNGQRNPPSNKYIVKISNVLDLDSNKLIFDAGRVPPKLKLILKSVFTEIGKFAEKFEGKEDEFAYKALDRFLSTEEGFKWYQKDFEEQLLKASFAPTQDNSAENKIEFNMETSFIGRALDYFFKTPEGEKWFKDEYKIPEIE